MNNEVVKIIKQLKGNVIGIGLNEKMVKAIEQNNEITECNLLNSYVQGDLGKKKRLKTIKIKKLSKYFAKKSIDTIICNYETIQKYMNTFVKNSVYLNKHKLYFFGSIDKELISSRYSRYETKINFKDMKDGTIVIIDNEKSRNHKIKEIGYRFKDGFSKAIDLIGDVLMN